MTLFELAAKLSLDTTDFNSGIKNAVNSGQNFANLLSQKVTANTVALGNAMYKVAETGVKAMISLGKSAAGLVKDSFGNYAEYEQLVGGVETLFKSSSDQIMRYASNAYKTAGLSANDYMSTVTSFAASLVQGLGGDTEAAAQIANTAIVDMADNANKMGTDMTMIQNAYQGFAKQNYTMLDNLKLGYGGTQAEMARLINDSGVLGSTVKVTANTVNSVSFDKMIQAIHVVQKQMGITGTTAQEASDTISGSIAAMQAAWSNLLTGLSDEDQDVDQLFENFDESLETVTDNILDVAPRFVKNFGRLFDSVGTQLLSRLEDWWDNGNVVLNIIKRTARWVLPMFDMPYNHDVQKTITDWWNNTLLPATENMGSFWTDLVSAMDEVKLWIEQNRGIVIAFFGALAIAGLAVNAPFTLLAGVLLLVAANWEMLKKSATAIAEVVIEAWNSVISTIQNAIDKVNEFFGMDGSGPVSPGQTFGTADEKEVVDAWANALSSGSDEAVQKAWDKVRATLGEFDSEEFKKSYVQLLEEAGVESGIEIPAEWFPGTAEKLQSDLDAMDLSTTITVKPRYEGFDSVFDYAQSLLEQGDDQDAPGKAVGMDYVPYNDYLARLHEGEAVLTKSEATAWRRGEGQGVTIDLNGLAEALGEVINDRPIAINIDGKAFAAIMAKEMARSIGNRNIQTLMGMGG